MAAATRVTVFISGTGTNLQAVIDAVRDGTIDAEIVRVISNRRDAYGLERARLAHIPTHYHNLLKYKKQHQPDADGTKAAREDYDAELARLVLIDKPDLIVCLGFMHVLTPNFLDPVAEASVKIINLHPALPGAFSGANAIERAHAAWLSGTIDRTGVMIHEVIADVDMGSPIVVKEVPFIAGVDENLEVLEQRIHEVEWAAVIEAIQQIIPDINRKGA